MTGVQLLQDADGTTRVEVRLAVLQGYEIESSNVCGHPEQDEWPDALKRAINRRRADGGEDKGRVLYLLQTQFPSAKRMAIGALILHFEDRMVRVMNLGAIKGRSGSQKRSDLTALLNCAQRVAIEHKCTRLEWQVYGEADAKSACSLYGFRRVRRNDRRCKALRANVILLERL